MSSALFLNSDFSSTCWTRSVIPILSMPLPSHPLPHAGSGLLCPSSSTCWTRYVMPILSTSTLSIRMLDQVCYAHLLNHLYPSTSSSSSTCSTNVCCAHPFNQPCPLNISILNLHTLTMPATSNRSHLIFQRRSQATR